MVGKVELSLVSVVKPLLLIRYCFIMLNSNLVKYIAATKTIFSGSVSFWFNIYPFNLIHCRYYVWTIDITIMIGYSTITITAFTQKHVHFSHACIF
jgi:hypothetical protein